MTPEQLAKSGSEHAEQRALFAWANMAEKYGWKVADNAQSYTIKGYAEEIFSSYAKDDGLVPLPQLKWLHAIHNQGHGDAIRGGKAKAEGVKAGVSDVFLPCPTYNAATRAGYHGLYLEMKRANGKDSDLSDEQLKFMDEMRLRGYYCKVGYGWIDAKTKLLEYLGIV